MNILWFIDKQLDIAPNSSRVIEVIKCLQESFQVFIVTGYKKNKKQFDDLYNEIIYMGIINIPFLKRIIFYVNQIINLNKSILKYKPNIIIFNTSNFFLLKKAKNLSKKYKYKTFLDIRTLPVYSNKLRNAVEKALFKKSLIFACKYFDGVTYITKEMRYYCEKTYNLPQHRSEIWTSGVNINLFKPGNVRNNSKTFRLIYHGSISNNRDLNNVIEALSLLRNYPIKLFLLGSGNGVAKLKILTTKLKLEKRVIFHPFVRYKEVPKFIKDSDVGILPFHNWPGWNTSSPIKLFEYLSCGKPVIVTKIPAHISVLEGQDFAFWAESSSTIDIARAVKEAYSLRAQFENIGKKAREFATINYTWENQAQKIKTFIIG